MVCLHKAKIKFNLPETQTPKMVCVHKAKIDGLLAILACNLFWLYQMKYYLYHIIPLCCIGLLDKLTVISLFKQMNSIEQASNREYKESCSIDITSSTGEVKLSLSCNAPIGRQVITLNRRVSRAFSTAAESVPHQPHATSAHEQNSDQNDVPSSSESNVKSNLLNMGFSQALWTVIEEKGEDNVELLVETLLSFEDLQKSNSRASDSLDGLFDDKDESSPRKFLLFK